MDKEFKLKQTMQERNMNNVLLALRIVELVMKKNV